MAVYTRTGDDGTTALFGGKRVLKCIELVEVFGSVDELNSWLGVIIAQLKSSGEISFFQEIQRDLFLIGSILAGGKGNTGILAKRVIQMEKRIDRMEDMLPRLHHFILPGGTQLGSFVHLARSVCRRVERQTVALVQKQSIDRAILAYLNRLSDLLFILARRINIKRRAVEIVWKGESRK